VANSCSPVAKGSRTNQSERSLKPPAGVLTSAMSRGPMFCDNTFASKLAMSGVNDRSLQALGRWKEPKMIQRYAHLSPQHLREAVEKIAQNCHKNDTSAIDETRKSFRAHSSVG
jgi:hypothetical protein